MESYKDKDKNTRPEKDDRIPCRYGAKCYQKNPSHQKKFKHPKKENVNEETIGKKRKSPGDSEESSSSRTPKFSKFETSSRNEDSSDKTENSKDLKVNENAVQDKTNSTELTKKDSDNASNNDSTTENVTNDETGTNADKKAGGSETETNDVNSFSNTKDVEEKTDTEEKNTKVEGSTDDTVHEKSTDDESKECDTEEKDSKRPNDKEMLPTSPKQNTQEKNSKIKTPISNKDNLSETIKLIEKVFLVSMPNDFYKFYEFCRDIKPADPATAFKVAELKLVGPYDVLNGLITKEIAETTNLLTHWRYYYDPPEFQTVIKGNDKEGLHFGYWRDRPSSNPVFVATNCSNVSHKIKPVAENIFGAITYYLEERIKKANPFEKAGFTSLMGKLKNFAKKHNFSLETQSDKMKSREKNVVARTIHGAGIVCPYNKKSQLGYRELSVTDNQLLKIVKKLDDAQNEEEKIAAHSELGEVVRLATIAGDECDFGTCLELGHDLWSTGCFHVQNAALVVLSIAYNQLDRQAFLKIFEAHMQNRKKSSNTSALESVSKE